VSRLIFIGLPAGGSASALLPLAVPLRFTF
jgi:hypothetical protein